MIFVRDKGQMCNNILQYAHVYAWAKENHRHSMSMRFAYKYQYFKICNMKNHNFLMYISGKYGAKYKILPVITYDLGEEGKAEKEAFTLCHKNVIIEGWGVRYYDLFLKYKQDILELFDFKEEIHHKINNLLLETSDDDTVKIGVHIRRGDYQTFFNGIYFFYDYAFLHYIKQIMALFPGRRFSVYICGNDPALNQQYYINALPEAKIVFPNGNAGEDLCILSECDYIIGPPSSYSLVATMYGKAKLHWMISDNGHITLEDFKDFDTLFRTFDSYWINPPKPKKKVLFLISRFLDGGIDTVLVEYINNLCTLTNHKISLGVMLKMQEFEVFAKRLPSNINIFYLVQNNLLTWYKKRSIIGRSKSISVFDEIFLNPIRRLLTIIRLRQKCKQFDVIIDFDSTFGSMISTKTKARKISFFHFSFATELKRDTRHMKRRLANMKKFDYVVTLSNAMLKEAQNIAPDLKGRLVRIYNSINLHRILVQAKAPVDDPRINNNYILAIERLEETQKDITTLVETYAMLKRRDSQKNIPPLYIIGEGKSRNDIEKHIKMHNLDEDIILLGFIENPYPWMAKAQLIVHSSKFEGLPTVLIEALMLNKLIVSSDCPTGPAEILKKGKAGILVPVGDVEAFANAIEHILSDKQLQGNLLHEIKRHKKTFMAEKNISTLEQLF